MKIFFIIFLTTLFSFKSTASNFNEPTTCKINNCTSRVNSPQQFLMPIEKYRLNVQLNKTYKSTNIYLNNDKFPIPTNEKGELNYTIPLRKSGNQCLKIRNVTFQFNLNANMTVTCMGKENFCCKITTD